MDFKGIYEKDNFMIKTLEEQQAIYKVIDATFKNDRNTMPDKLNIFYKEAEKNNIPVLDYLGMLYFDDANGIEASLYYATCLSLYASANGSKISSSRIKSLLAPAYNYIISNVDKIALYDTYNLTDENCEDFILTHISSVIVFEMQLDLNEILDMRKDFSKYPDYMILDLEDVIQDKLQKMVDYLGL